MGFQTAGGFAYNDYTITGTSATTSWWDPVQQRWISDTYPPPANVYPAPEPEPNEGAVGWLDIELDKILMLGRAEPVLA